jgi:hypothetical protein
LQTVTELNTGDQFFGSRLKQFLFVAGVALVITAALALQTDSLTPNHPDFSNPWDHHKYIWMASHNPFDFHIAPFCWRVVTPALARAVPLDTQRSFFLISFMSVWMTGVAVFYLARKFAFSKWTALSGMLMFFLLGLAAKSNLYNLWKPDPLGFLIGTLAIYTILAGRDWLFTVLLVIGIGVKESILFVVPLYYTLNAKRPVDFRLALRTLRLTIPAILALIALRTFIPMQNDDPSYLGTLPETLRQVQLGSSSYSIGWLWTEIGLPRLRTISTDAVIAYTIGTFGAVVLTLPLFSIRRNVPLLVRFLPFLILVYLQVLFATNVGRLLVIGFPAVILMALNGVESISRTFAVKTAYFAILLLVLIGMLILKVGMIVVPSGYEAIFFLVYLAICFSFGPRSNGEVSS